MNCKPGDLAVCIRDTTVNFPTSPLGRLCTVLHAASAGDFRLPDGHSQVGSAARKRTAEWVVEWQHEMAYPLDNGTFRMTRFGVCIDAALRPIRDPGDDAVDETLQRLPAPERSASTTKQDQEKVTS